MMVRSYRIIGSACVSRVLSTTNSNLLWTTPTSWTPRAAVRCGGSDAQGKLESEERVRPE